MTDHRNPPPDRLPARSFDDLARQINAQARRDSETQHKRLFLAIIGFQVVMLAVLIVAGLIMEAGK